MGTVDVTQLIGYWDHLESLLPGLDAADELAQQATVLSQRRFDEAQPVGLDTYINARQLIGAAMDNLRGLRVLIEHRGMTPWAPWVLLRAAFEAAALAVWLLDPSDGLERRRRGLRRVIEDRRQWAAWMEALAKEDPSAYTEFQQRLDDTKTRQTRQTQQLGMTPSNAGARPNLIDELPKLRVLKLMEHEAKWFVTLWRSLSGMTHGLPYAGMANTTEHSSTPMPGGAYQLRSIDDNTWSAHAMGCSLLLLDAMQLYNERSAPPKPNMRAH